MILTGVFIGGYCLPLRTLSAAQVHTKAAFDSSSTTDGKNAGDNEQVPATPSKLDEIIDQMIKRENHDEIPAFDLYTPIIETYIQESNSTRREAQSRSRTTIFLGKQISEGDSKFTR